MSEQKNGTEKKKGGRDKKGRFAPGNPGGPGNPFARQVGALRKAAAEAGTPEQVALVLRAMYEKAVCGDVAAAKVWLAYVAGRPSPPPDPDTLDAHELEVRRRSVLSTEDLHAAQAIPARQMCWMARIAEPFVHARSEEELARGMGMQKEMEEARAERPARQEAQRREAAARKEAAEKEAASLRERAGLPPLFAAPAPAPSQEPANGHHANGAGRAPVPVNALRRKGPKADGRNGRARPRR
jgi:hypothetical protein